LRRALARAARPGGSRIARLRRHASGGCHGLAISRDTVLALLYPDFSQRESAERLGLTRGKIESAVRSTRLK
jgi:hypothetical protein